MDSKPFVGDRLGKQDYLLASVIGIVFAFLYLVFAPRGMEPALWDEMCVAAGLRPPEELFPGGWRFITHGLLALVGIGRIVVLMRIVGCVIGGICVAIVYLSMRQVLAHLCRVRDIESWSGRARLITLLAAICFGAGDAMWRVVSPASPGLFLFLLLMVAVHLFLRWLTVGGVWRLVAVMFISGVIAAESTAGLALPLFAYISYRLYLDALTNNKVTSDGNVPSLMMMPIWRVFFAFLIGLSLFTVVNIYSFVAFDGLAASGWGPLELVINYVIGYYRNVAGAASPVGWLLAMTFSILPLIASLVIFPMLCRDSEPIRFRPGLILLFAGVLAILQGGILPYTDIWMFSSSGSDVRSDFLECIFAQCTASTIALAGSCFTLACLNRFMYDSDDGTFAPYRQRGYFMRSLVPWVIVVCLLPVLSRIYRPAESEMRSIVSDALHEIVRECGDAKFLFTDGRLDAGIELVANEMGAKVRPLNMMGGASNWDKYIRTRHFKEGSPDHDLATTGTAVLLRVWAGEKDNGMDDAAAQLGFEFWHRAKKPLPAQSGMVARTKGIDAVETERGTKAANRLAQRIIRISKTNPHAAASDELKNALSAISWRISRFARMRDDETLANSLDEENEAVKHMMRLIEYERMRTFMQLTPYEGLRLALRRADFAEARRYAHTVLQMDPQDAEANFGTGMAFLMEEKYKDAEFYLERTLQARPEEPAVLNNLSIIYRKTNRLEKALEFVKKAHELLPANEEIVKTLKDTEKAIEARKSALRSAFR